MVDVLATNNEEESYMISKGCGLALYTGNYGNKPGFLLTTGCNVFYKKYVIKILVKISNVFNQFNVLPVGLIINKHVNVNNSFIVLYWSSR